MSKDGANWSIEHRKGAKITCTYDVLPPVHSFEWTGTHYPITTKTFFHGMGNAFLMTPPITTAPCTAKPLVSGKRGYLHLNLHAAHTERPLTRQFCGLFRVRSTS